MALGNPIDAWLQMAQNRNQNQQQMNQDIAGLGQGLGQSFGSIGQIIGEQKKKALMQQIMQAMKTQGAPQQGPPLAPMGTPQPQSMTQIPPGQPMAAGGNIGQDVQMPQPIPTQGPGQPASGMGGPAQDNSKLIQSLMMQYDPQAMMKQMSQKPSSPWRVVSGMMSGKNPIQQNEQTGEVRSVPLEVTPTGKGNANFGIGSVSWDTATEEDKALAKALYEGNIRPYDLGYRDRSLGTKLANEYAIKNGLPPFQSYSGDVHAGTAKAFAFGKPAMNVLSLNTALGHTQTAMNAYDAVSNLDVRFLNSPLNKVREQTNDPNIIKLQTSLNALQGELASTFKGSAGTDQEIGYWAKVLSQDLTPKQAIGAIQQVGDLLNSRLDALNQMRMTGMGKPGGSPLLSPHAKTISESISQRGGKQKSFTSVQEAEAAGLPVGTKVMINGRPATIQ